MQVSHILRLPLTVPDSACQLARIRELTCYLQPMLARRAAASHGTWLAMVAAASACGGHPAAPTAATNPAVSGAPATIADVRIANLPAALAPSEIVHPFRTVAAGPVQIRTWWSVDYNDALRIELWCEGGLLRTGTQRAGSAGGVFTQDAPGPAGCEMRLRQVKSDAGTKYRVAIRYPH